MTQDTDKLLEKLISGAEITAEEMQALSAEDRECNDLIKALSAVDIHDEPPSHLDTAILQHAHTRVSSTKRPVVFYFRLALTAAAALLFTLIVIQLLPVRSNRPGPVVDKKPDEGLIVLPDRSKVVNNKVRPTIAKDDSIPEFDWDADSITKEMALLEAEIFMDELDYADAALVENFE